MIAWYVAESGPGARRILRSGTAPDLLSAALQAHAGETAHIGEAGDATHYVMDGEARAREPMPAFDRLSIPADGQSAARVSGVPLPARVTIDGPLGRSSFALSDPEFAVVADDPGSYRVRIVAESPRWLALEVDIQAV